MDENKIDMELYNAALERQGVHLASKVDNTNYSRTRINKVYVDNTKKQTKDNNEDYTK